MTFRLTCVCVVYGSVLVAGWPPFGKCLIDRLTVCSLCVLTICNVGYFSFWF